MLGRKFWSSLSTGISSEQANSLVLGSSMSLDLSEGMAFTDMASVLLSQLNLTCCG